MAENVILVNQNDQMTGTMDKFQAHKFGKLHRAFSIFLFNTKGDLLLQQRAFDKYHSGGKWTNTCCSHPKPGEDTADAANRRLGEEMGMCCELTEVFCFSYNADVGNGLTENELDHVFFGVTDNLPVPNPDEVFTFKYLDMTELANELHNNPDDYTEWLKICFDTVMLHYPNRRQVPSA